MLLDLLQRKLFSANLLVRRDGCDADIQFEAVAQINRAVCVSMRCRIIALQLVLKAIASIPQSL